MKKNTKPNIQIDDVVREMTDEEYQKFLDECPDLPNLAE